MKIQQKVLKYTPIQKLKMLFVGLLAGIKAVSHTATTIRLDEALMSAFGLLGCAEQSVLADTLNAATEADVAALRVALTKIFERYSQVRQHDFQQGLLVLDVDLSPLPASAKARLRTRLYGTVALQDGAQVSTGTSSSDPGNGLGGYSLSRWWIIQPSLLSA